MKKTILISSLILFLLCLSVVILYFSGSLGKLKGFLAKDNNGAQKFQFHDEDFLDNREKLNDYIYIDKNTVSINKHGYISAWFKVYDSDKHDLFDVEGVPVNSEFIKYEADCVEDALELMHVKSFDKSGKILLDEPNEYNCFSSHSGVWDGEYYYNALCKYRKNDDLKQNENIEKYDKKDTVSLDEYLMLDKTEEDFKALTLNENGDVIYKNKVITNDKGLPVNDNTAYSTIELKIYFAAKGIKPKEGCDPSDTVKNGTIGCYIDIPDE